MKLALLLALLIINHFNCSGQTDLQKISDTAKGRLLYEKADFQLKSGQLDSALRYVLYADSMLKKQHFNYGLAKARFVQGKIWARKGNLNKAEEVYKNVHALLTGDTSYAARRLYAITAGNLSTILGKRGYPDRELKMLLTVVPVFEALKDTPAIAISMFNIANKFINTGQTAKAYPYLMKNITLVHLKGQPEQQASSFITAATLFIQLDSLDRAGYYLSKSFAILEKTGKSSLWGPYYIYLAMYQSKIGNYKKAEQSCILAEAALKDFPDKNNAYNLLTAEMKIYESQKKSGVAIHAAEQIYKMAIRDSSAYYHLSSLKDLSNLEEKAGNINQSFNYLKQYTMLKDSLDQHRIKLHINELEQQYQADQKEKSILKLKNQNTQQELALQHNRFSQMIYLLLLGCFLLLFFLLRNKQRSSKQRNLLLNQELDHVKKEQQINNYIAMLDGQESERARLARELHDGLGGRLSAIQLNMANLPEEAGDWSRKTSRQLEEAITELRQIARNLMPDTLLRFGLTEAIKDYCYTLKEGGINVVFDSFDISDHIPRHQQLTLFRVVQEAITNVLKHASAHRILVQLSQVDNMVYISIEDDGIGFDIKTAKSGSGLGNIKARVSQLDGIMDIQSMPGKGTVINIECKVDE
jgi:two-component system NarL family sensor kinase